MADLGAFADGLLGGYSVLEQLNNQKRRTDIYEKHEKRAEEKYQDEKRERAEKKKIEQELKELNAAKHAMKTGARFDPIKTGNIAFRNDLQATNEKETKISQVYPDPNNKGNVLIELDVGGKKVPMTENRSTDKDDPVKSVPVVDLLNEFDKEISIREIMADPRYGKDPKFMEDSLNKINTLIVQRGDNSPLEDLRIKQEREQRLADEDRIYKRNRADQLADRESSQKFQRSLHAASKSRAIAREERAHKRNLELYGIKQDREQQAALAKGQTKVYQDTYVKAIENGATDEEAKESASIAAASYASQFDPAQQEVAREKAAFEQEYNNEASALVTKVKSGQATQEDIKQFNATYGEGKAEGALKLNGLSLPSEPQITTPSPQQEGLTVTSLSPSRSGTSRGREQYTPEQQSLIEKNRRTEEAQSAYNQIMAGAARGRLTQKGKEDLITLVDQYGDLLSERQLSQIDLMLRKGDRRIASQ